VSSTENNRKEYFKNSKQAKKYSSSSNSLKENLSSSYIANSNVILPKIDHIIEAYVIHYSLNN